MPYYHQWFKNTPYLLRVCKTVYLLCWSDVVNLKDIAPTFVCIFRISLLKSPYGEKVIQSYIFKPVPLIYNVRRVCYRLRHVKTWNIQANKKALVR